MGLLHSFLSIMADMEGCAYEGSIAYPHSMVLGQIAAIRALFIDPGQWPVRYRALSPISVPHTFPSWLAKAFRVGIPRYITMRGYDRNKVSRLLT